MYILHINHNVAYSYAYLKKYSLKSIFFLYSVFIEKSNTIVLVPSKNIQWIASNNIKWMGIGALQKAFNALLDLVLNTAVAIHHVILHYI